MAVTVKSFWEQISASPCFPYFAELEWLLIAVICFLDGNLYSLAFDGSSGILYGAGSHGALFICNTISSSFACSTVLDGLPYIHGITVDLAEG